MQFDNEEINAGVDRVTARPLGRKIKGWWNDIVDWATEPGEPREEGDAGGRARPSDIEEGMRSGIEEFRENAPEGPTPGMEMDEGRNEYGAEVPVSGRYRPEGSLDRTRSEPSVMAEVDYINSGSGLTRFTRMTQAIAEMSGASGQEEQAAVVSEILGRDVAPGELDMVYQNPAAVEMIIVGLQ